MKLEIFGGKKVTEDVLRVKLAMNGGRSSSDRRGC